MQLLFQRSLRIGEVRTDRSQFVLWVKFEVDAEEERLINTYNMSSAYITIEYSRRDFWRALIISFFIALFVTFFVESRLFLGVLPTLALFLVLFAGSTWIIYEQLREAIRISDLLRGRNFKNRSLALLVRRERRMVGYAAAFIHLLEAMRNWEGTEVIKIGPEHEPALRLVTDTYAPV